jgi:hypothetical protein
MRMVEHVRGGILAIKKHTSIRSGVGALSWMATGTLAAWGGSLPNIVIVPLLFLFAGGTAVGKSHAMHIRLIALGALLPVVICTPSVHVPVSLTGLPITAYAAMLACTRVLCDDILQCLTR